MRLQRKPEAAVAGHYLETYRLIRRQAAGFRLPSVTEVSAENDPYLVLVSCILSLRTKDNVALQASRRLFAKADGPRAMLGLTEKKIAGIIFPVGFYRTKAGVILGASRLILERFGGRVPRTQEELLSIKGVGRKTANLVLGLGYGIPAICVDVHVHRVSNRLGWVSTHKVEETEAGLQKLFPRRYWIELNTVIVAFGQNICRPVSPHCGSCAAAALCPRVGVEKSR